jgi:6-phosphogluconolactonase (cycloisomerase 2 family)
VGKRGQVFVSEAVGGAAAASSLSSYRLRSKRGLATISAAVPTGETAACWVALTPDGRYAFTTNTGSGTISAFRIGHSGRLALADADAGNTGAGSGPIDLGLSPDGRQMFVLNQGNETIASFRVGPYGQLTPVDTVGDLPDGANGIAVR